MKYSTYLKYVENKFPEARFDVIMSSTGMNRVDLVHKVAEMLFVESECTGILASETRNQMVSLRTAGVLCFEHE